MSGSQVTVRVGLSERAYDIQIGTGMLAEAGSMIRTTLGNVSRAVLVVDDNVHAHADVVRDSLLTQGVACDSWTVPPGETSKSLESAARGWQTMLDLGIDRKSLVVAIGGGVVGDLAGFLAATYARGLRFCQIPTTLLAQVDSSVGGKTGINLPGAKNMIGAFWQPALVLIDTQVLTTLADREYVSGLAEVVKYGVILDADFFASLEARCRELLARDPATLRSVVARCCRLKADVVEADERETSGLRAVLNYGHTFAHAIEAVAGYGQLLHGEAVAIGMVCASRLAEHVGRVGSDVTERQIRLLHSLGLPTELPDLDDRRLWQAMSHDKKVEHGQLRFVLPDRLGHVDLTSGISEEAVLQILKACHGVR